MQEMFDTVLTTAAFDQFVAVLFMDDAVFGLKQNQHAETLMLKSTLGMIHAFPLYDVHDIYVESESLTERGLDLTDIDSCKIIKSIPRNAVNALIRQFDHVISG
jgi:tRNA 2-thiouridine synthesizing protein C